MATTCSTIVFRSLLSTLSSVSIMRTRAVENSPASIRRARSTSCGAVSSGTLPISFRYIRTGSFVGAFSRSSSRASAGAAASARSSPGTSMTSMPSVRRCSSTCVRKSSTCSGVRSSTGMPSRTSSEVTNPRSRPRAVIASLASSKPKSRTSVTGSPCLWGLAPKVYEKQTSTDRLPRLLRRRGLAESPQLPVERDQLLEQPVVLRIVGPQFLEPTAHVRAPPLQQQLLQPARDRFRVLACEIPFHGLHRELRKRTDELFVVGCGNERADVAARSDDDSVQLSILRRLEMFLGYPAGELANGIGISREKLQHLAFHPLLDGDTPSRSGRSGRCD